MMVRRPSALAGRRAPSRRGSVTARPGAILLAAAALATTMIAGSAAAAIPSDDPTPMGDMDMGDGGAATPSVASQPAASSPGMNMNDMGRSGGMGSAPRAEHQWRHPEQVAGAGLVRIDTSADVFMAVHGAHLHRYTFTLQDAGTTTTGFVVNPQGAVVTSSTALKDDAKQTERYVVAAVNEGYIRSGYLPDVSNQADLYSRTHVPAKIRFKEGKEVDLEERLQSCYAWRDPMSHCAVFIRPKVTVTPLTGAAAAEGGHLGVVVGRDDKVGVLTTTDKATPLTLAFEDGVRGSQYWLVAASGGAPRTMTGTLTSDPEKPVSDADLKKMWTQFGSSAAGSPLVSRTGGVVGMLGRTGDGFEVIPGDHLARDSTGKAGISLASGPMDTRFRDGIVLFESNQFRAARTTLDPVVQATGGQVMPVALDQQAKAKQDTAADMTDMANSHTDMDQDDAAASGTWLWWLVGGLLLVLLAGAAWWTRARWVPAFRSPVPQSGPPADDGTRRPESAAPSTGEPEAVATGPGSHTSSDDLPLQRATGPTRLVDAAPAPARPAGAASGDVGPVQTTILATPSLEDAPTGGSGRSGSAPAVPGAKAAPVGGSFCVQCGSQLSPGDRFCYSCGTPAR